MSIYSGQFFCPIKAMKNLFVSQGNAVFQLQEKKKAFKEQELKGKTYKKKLDDLQIALIKHMEQYVNLRNGLECCTRYFNISKCLCLQNSERFSGCRKASSNPGR